MTIDGLKDYLGQFDGDTLVFLSEEQAFDLTAGIENPEYVVLNVLDYEPDVA